MSACRRQYPGRSEGVKSLIYYSLVIGLPQVMGGSAPALPVSGPAQRSLALQPTDSPGRLCDLLHRRLRRLCCLHRRSDCYRVERSSSRAGLSPAVVQCLFTAHHNRVVMTVNAVFNISNDVGVVKWLAELFFLVSSTLLRNDRVGSPTDVLGSISFCRSPTIRLGLIFVTSVEWPTRHLSGHPRS
jgi:hypothetical protein